jgi:DNA-binding response OmpR family regulator
MRILIVEDEPLIALMIADILRRHGHQPIGPAYRLEEGLALIEATSIDAAILDLNLTTARSDRIACRLQARSIPFFFLSGHTSAEVPEPYRDRLFLSKPFTQATLAKALRALSA